MWPFLYRDVDTARSIQNQQIPLHDQSIIVKQNEHRIANHTHSEKAKAPIARRCPADCIAVGDLVYLFSDRNKTRTSDRFLLAEITGFFCNIGRFVGSWFQSTSYCVKTSDCHRAPSEVTDVQPWAINSDTNSSSDEQSSHLSNQQWY